MEKSLALALERGKVLPIPLFKKHMIMSPMINVLILVCMVDVLKQRLSVKGQKRQMLPIWKSLEN